MTEALEVSLPTIQGIIQSLLSKWSLLFVIVEKRQMCKFLITGWLLFVRSSICPSKPVIFALFQNKSVHFPLRSKYNRLTKVARFLQENPSCLLCNILHHYLHQANYSVIDDATMVSVWQHALAPQEPLFCRGMDAPAGREVRVGSQKHRSGRNTGHRQQQAQGGDCQHCDRWELPAGRRQKLWM